MQRAKYAQITDDAYPWGDFGTRPGHREFSCFDAYSRVSRQRIAFHYTDHIYWITCNEKEGTLPEISLIQLKRYGTEND